MKSCFLIFCSILFRISYGYVQQGSVKELELENYYKNELGHERYERHVQTVTESVIDHLLKEVKKRYTSTRQLSNNQLSKIAKKISNKLKHLKNGKQKKEKINKLKKNVKDKGSKFQKNSTF